MPLVPSLITELNNVNLLAPSTNVLKVGKKFIKCWQFVYKTSLVYSISILALRSLPDAKTMLEFRGSHT